MSAQVSCEEFRRMVLDFNKKAGVTFLFFKGGAARLTRYQCGIHVVPASVSVSVFVS